METWLSVTSEELAYSTGEKEGGEPRDAPGAAFQSQREFDVELTIDKGRLSMEAHLNELVRTGDKARELHEQASRCPLLLLLLLLRVLLHLLSCSSSTHDEPVAPLRRRWWRL